MEESERARGNPVRPFLAPLICTAAALLLRVAYLIESMANPFRSFIGLDMTGYHRWAVAVLRGHGLGDMPFTQAPFYPLILAVTYLFTGQDWFRGVWGNLLPSVAAVFLAADAARRWRGPVAAWGAGLLLALYKPAIFYTGVLLPPSWVLFLAALSLWFAIRLVLDEEPPHRRFAAGAGLSVGLLALAQPVAVLGAIPLVVRLGRRDRGVHSDRGPDAGRRARAAAGRSRALIFVVAAAILPLGTFFYNGLGGKAWSFISVNGGINLYIGNGPEANGAYVRPPAMREDRDLLGIGAARTLTGTPDLGFAAANRFWTDRALSWAAGHPGRTAGLFLRKLHLFLGQYEVPQVESLSFERHYSRLLRWPFPGMAVLAALGLFGFLVRRRDGVARGLAWSFLAVAVGVCAFFVTARFRAPVVPLLAVLGGAGIAEYAAITGSHPGGWTARFRFGSGSRGEVAVAAVAAALFAVVLVLNLSGVQRDVSDGQSYLRLGIILERQKEPAEATEAYRRALALDPSLGKAEVNLGTLLARAQRFDEARTHLERGVALDTLSVIGLTNLGQLDEVQGRREEALALYRRALAVDPRHTTARRSAIQLLQDSGRMDEARRLAMEGAALSPPSTPVPDPQPDPSAGP